jgi:transcriptional regulator with XRE-family HTH domain
LLKTGSQLAAARALVNITQAELATRAGLSTNTIRNMEATHRRPISGRVPSIRAVQSTLEAAGVRFLPEEASAGIGVRMAKHGAAL